MTHSSVPPRDAEDPDAAAPDRLVDAPPVCEGGVEAAGELDRRGVADGELHRRHRVDPAVHEGRGRAGVL
ncbi:hypothetical protein ASG80_02545 [Agromyces sp. Soil535]|nr:hypothetical protein ASG80_02545 [Agromyces sp. Soil535]